MTYLIKYYDQILQSPSDSLTAKYVTFYFSPYPITLSNSIEKSLDYATVEVVSIPPFLGDNCPILIIPISHNSDQSRM